MSRASGRPVAASDRHRWRRTVVLVAMLLVGGAVLLGDQAGPTSIIRVDFGRSIAPTPAVNIGFTATTLDVEGGPVPRNAADMAAITALGAGAVRIHLTRAVDGSVISGAAGGNRGISADQWLDTYARLGARPTVVLNLDKAEALAVLAFLRAGHRDVRRFVIGNEMDDNSRANVPAVEYVTRFREIAGAMRAVDPGLEIGGPASADFEGVTHQLIEGLVRAPIAERASFIDYHAYGGEQRATMASSWRYAGQLDRLRAMIGDSSVGMQVGEYNFNWADDPQNNSHVQSVWVAAALGTILSRGAVAFQYGDKNHAMGLVADGAPKASYWGLAAFTGASRFRPFGTTMVASTSSNPAVRVFASAGAKNVVLVNTGGATTVTLNLTGFAGGTATIWQDASWDFSDAGTVALGSSLTMGLPAMSVTTLVLDEQLASAKLAVSYIPTRPDSAHVESGYSARSQN